MKTEWEAKEKETPLDHIQVPECQQPGLNTLGRRVGSLPLDTLNFPSRTGRP